MAIVAEVLAQLPRAGVVVGTHVDINGLVCIVINYMIVDSGDLHSASNVYHIVITCVTIVLWAC